MSISPRTILLLCLVGAAAVAGINALFSISEAEDNSKADIVSPRSLRALGKNSESSQSLAETSSPRDAEKIVVESIKEKGDVDDDDEGRRTLHLIHSVFGDKPTFLDQWEVSLKSVLFNAPLDMDLHVHIFCDGPGSAAVRAKILDVAKLSGTKWRNCIQLTVTNVESHIQDLETFLKNVLSGPANKKKRRWMDKRLGIGAFFRLFAYKFMMEYVGVDDNDYLPMRILTEDAKHHGEWQQQLPPLIDAKNKSGQRRDPRKDLRQAVYHDADVVIISNLNDLAMTMDGVVKNYNKTEHNSLEPTPKLGPLWILGQHNSGFMGINVLEFDSFWEAVKQCEAIKLDGYPKKNDQWLLHHVMKCYPDIWAAQPEPSPWSIHIGHGFRQSPQKLGQQKHRVAGMLHLQSPAVANWFDGDFHRNGIDSSGYSTNYVGHFCKRGAGCNHENGKHMMAVRNTWGLADYYVRVSWEWAIYQSGTSRIRSGEKGHEIDLVFRDAVDCNTSFYFSANGNS